MEAAHFFKTLVPIYHHRGQYIIKLYILQHHTTVDVNLNNSFFSSINSPDLANTNISSPPL
jgi:hypothetical protein